MRSADASSGLKSRGILLRQLAERATFSSTAALAKDPDGGEFEPVKSTEEPSNLKMEESSSSRTLPSASGQGGLVSMLQGLRQIKLKRKAKLQEEVEASDSVGTDASLVKSDVNSNNEISSSSYRLQSFLDASEVEKKIIRQVEFYFGDYNLPKDRFMQELLEDNSGWISMDTMLTFKRLAELSKDVDLIMEALVKSPNRLIEVDFLHRQIRRHPDCPLPEMDKKRELELEARTVFVYGFNKEETKLDDLIDYFEGKFDKVCNIRMRYCRDQGDAQPRCGSLNDREDNRKFLGSVFITFDNNQAARNFLNIVNSDEGAIFKGSRLKAKPKAEFIARRFENNDKFDGETLGRTFFVHGFDKMDTTEDELVDFFGDFDGAESVKKRVFRENANREATEGKWRFSGSVFVTFEDEATATEFFDKQAKSLFFGGDKLTVKPQLDFYESSQKFKHQVQKWKEETRKAY